MNYKIAVPEPIQDEIRGWGLSIEAEDELYASLEPGLTSSELDKCWRLAGPVPIFIRYVDFQDPLLLGITHDFTFYLEFGEEADMLYIVDAHHKATENWSEPDSDDAPTP